MEQKNGIQLQEEGGGGGGGGEEEVVVVVLTDEAIHKKSILGNLVSVFGLRFVILTALINYVFKGFVFGGGSDGLIGIPIQFILRKFGVNAARMQVLTTISISPWSLKPLIATLSDLTFIRGRQKNPYILGSTVIAIIVCLSIFFLFPISPIILSILLFFVFLMIALSDVLLEGKIAEYTRTVTDLATDVVVFNYIGILIAQALSTILLGFLIERIDYEWFYLMPVPLFILFLFPVAYNWLNDEKYDPIVLKSRFSEKFDQTNNNIYEDYQQHWLSGRLPLKNILLHPRLTYYSKGELIPLFAFDLQKVSENGKIFLMALIVGLISIFNSILGLLDIDTLYLLISSILCALLMILTFFLLVDVRIAKIQTFVILYHMFSIDLSNAVFFFYTDNETQYPEGPHFSIFFYVTIMGVINVLFAFIGIMSYNMFMKHWSYRSVLIITNTTCIIVSIFNVFFYKRLNVQWGVPDTVFVIGSDILHVIAFTWVSIPITGMMYKLCPDGVESTVFALLAGSSNLGLNLASYQGAYVMNAFHIQPNGSNSESVQFENLWIAAFVDLIIRFFPLIFVYFLIPDVAQNKNLLTSRDEEIAERRERESGRGEEPIPEIEEGEATRREEEETESI